ncbi:TetR/AcrR family transcriptional regulator [Thalassospira marina]|uniref:TetR family transcriptional regulator n=1 Tax=Thalassospira marina TaxID=2048283 RepID=A0ABN5FHJ7_9PROT|nr:TetR/AcrR family transcriptional regulator [Thalassospira marina]AUG53429.1 TetR family transcriptional regulator [Thalassospira marina]
MRVSREQAAENRLRILQVASQLFREKGFDGIGVVDIMKAAGLTHGGFYGHFKSKQDLEEESCRRTLANTRDLWQKRLEKDRTHPIAGLVDGYLTVRHRDDPGQGCAFAALAPDAARQGNGVRDAFSDGLKPLIGMVEQAIAGEMPEVSGVAEDDGSSIENRTENSVEKNDLHQEALSLISEMVGALLLSRLVTDDTLSQEFLEASKNHLKERSQRL